MVMSSAAEFINMKFVAMEEFSFLYPFFKSVGRGGHGQDHGRDLFV